MKPILPTLSAVTDPRSIYARRFLITLVVTLGTVLETLDVTIVSVAAPSMMGNLGATLDEVAWVTTGYALANIIVLPISGWLGDWFGRRNYFALSILLFTLASAMCGISSSLEELVFWRVVQGLGGGGLISTAQVVLIEIFPARELGVGMAIWGTGLTLGPSIGPPIGGWLTETLSWPWVFYVNLPLGAITLLLALVYVPDSRFAKKPDKVDAIGLILLAVGLGCMQSLLERGEHLDWFASREIVACALIGPAALILLVIHELRCPHPIIDMRVFSDRQFAASGLLMMMVGVAATCYIFAFPVMLQTIHGYTAAQAGLAIVPFMLTTMVGFATTGKLVSNPKLDLRLLIVAGIAIVSLGYWQQTHFTAQSGGADFLLSQIILGFGIPMVVLPATTLCTATLRQELVAVGNGLANVGRQFGGSLGIAVYATLITHFHGTSRGELVRHVNVFAEAATARLALWRDLLISHGTPLTVVPSKAVLLLDMEISREAQVIAFNQTMGVIAIGILLTFFVVPLLKTGHNAAGPGLAH